MEQLDCIPDSLHFPGETLEFKLIIRTFSIRNKLCTASLIKLIRNILLLHQKLEMAGGGGGGSSGVCNVVL